MGLKGMGLWNCLGNLRSSSPTNCPERSLGPQRELSIPLQRKAQEGLLLGVREQAEGLQERT